MEKESNQSPIIRVLVIIIVGTIAFGLLFNLLTGGTNMDHTGGTGNMGGYGSTLDTFLGGLLILLIKLLMVVLVIAVIVGIGLWVKNTFFKNTNTNQLFRVINNDPILKTVSVITISVFGIILFLSLLDSLSVLGTGMGSNTGGHGGMNGGFSTIFSVAGLLYLLIKVLSFVLVISLILALVAYIKKQYDQGTFNFITLNSQVKATEENPLTVPQALDDGNHG